MDKIEPNWIKDDLERGYKFSIVGKTNATSNTPGIGTTPEAYIWIICFLSIKTDGFVTSKDVGEKQKEYIKDIGPNQEDFFTAHLKAAKKLSENQLKSHTDRGEHAFNVYRRWFLDKDAIVEYDEYPYRFRLKSHRQYISKIIDNFINNVLIEHVPINIEKSNSLLFSKKQIILYGPPGTGKTYNSRKRAVFIVRRGENMVDTDAVKITEEINMNDNNYAQKFDELRQEGRIEFITFHPSYGYEEFIEGITADTTSDGGIKYYKKDGLFKKLCCKALANILEKNDIHVDEKDKWKSVYELFENSKPKDREELKAFLKKGDSFVLIIDEINRGNISKIFGELITLIEDDKRLGGGCEIIVRLPHTEDTFGVPSNVHIVGTMNTADRSIALLDVALRRRFQFEEMAPDFEILMRQSFYTETGNESLLHISVDALKKINVELSKMKRIGKDKRIGHAFLWNKKSDSEVLAVWKTEILPLLEEYLYGDYEELQTCFGSEMVDRYIGVNANMTTEMLKNSLKNKVAMWNPSSTISGG